MTNWNYPTFIAHRGAGKLAPENTLAAFRLGAGYGYRMFECDVKLSSDDVLFLLHDDTLDRTSNTKGIAGNLAWRDLSQIDAGSWHSRTYAGESLPTMDALASFILRNRYAVNFEIKPTEDCAKPDAMAYRTGERVAGRALELWKTNASVSAPDLLQTLPPLLSSFKVESLKGAKVTAPELPRGLLLDELWSGYLEAAQDLACSVVTCDYLLCTPAHIAKVKALGMRVGVYTVNDEGTANNLLAIGVDVIYTDRVDLFSPAA